MITSTYFNVYNDISKFIENQKSMAREFPIEWEYLHMASTAHLSRILAIKRGYDPEVAAIAALLHDMGRIVKGKQEGHAIFGKEPSIEILKNYRYSESIIDEIVSAVINHSKKEETGPVLDEIIKDADVIDCALYGLFFKSRVLN